MAPLISLQDVSKTYFNGDIAVEVLHHISLDIEAGEFVAIIGQSGSGKSTLMNILGCLDQPTSGSYFIEGENVSGFDSDELAALRRRTFGFIFQSYNLIPTASARENVEVPAVYAGVSAATGTIVPRRSCSRSSSVNGSIIVRTSFPVASSSAFRSPAP